MALGFASLSLACDDPEEGAETGTTESRAGSTAESSRDSNGSGPDIVYPDVGDPSPEAVVARAGDITVTLGDYRTFMRQSRLFAPSRDGGVPEIPASRKANPRVQSQSLRSLLEQRVLRRLAEDHGVEVSDEEVRTFIRDHEKLGRWAAVVEGDVEGKGGLPRGLDRSDLRTVARRRLRRRRLRDKLLETPSDEELWELYQNRRSRVRLAYVTFENSPTVETIDEFIERHTDDRSHRIRDYYRNHAEQFELPELVELAMVRPSGDAEVDRETLSKAAQKLGDGASPNDVAETLGLEAEAQAFLRRRENKEAFRSETGSTGFQMEGPRGAYAWRVEGRREGRLPELDRSMRREVAAQMIRETPVPSVRKRADSVLRAMRRVAERAEWPIDDDDLAPVRAVLADAGETLQTTEMFAANDQGRVPGLGLAEPVMERAFELTPESPVVEKPVLTRSRVIPFMLIEREVADRTTFRDERESFRETVLNERRKRVVRRRVRRWFSDHRPELNMEPIQAAYGRLKKP